MSDPIIERLRAYAEGQDEVDAGAKWEDHSRPLVVREQHRTMVARWYLAGVSLHEIARRNETTVQTAAADLAMVRKEWKRSRISDYHTALNQQLDRIDHIEERNWRAWEASQENQVRMRREEATTTRGTRTSTQTTQTRSTGDSTYMATIRWCVEERSKLLGLYAAVKVQAELATGRTPHDPASDADRLGGLIEHFLAHGTVDRPVHVVDGHATAILPRGD